MKIWRTGSGSTGLVSASFQVKLQGEIPKVGEPPAGRYPKWPKLAQHLNGEGSVEDQREKSTGIQTPLSNQTDSVGLRNPGHMEHCFSWEERRTLEEFEGNGRSLDLGGE